MENVEILWKNEPSKVKKEERTQLALVIKDSFEAQAGLIHVQK